MKNIWIIVLLAILIIVVLSGTTYYLVNFHTGKTEKELKNQISSLSQKTNSDSESQYAGWKTYTNNELNISFKVPNDWNNFSLVKDTTKTDSPWETGEYFGGTVYSSNSEYPDEKSEYPLSIKIVNKDYRNYIEGPGVLYLGKKLNIEKGEEELSKEVNEISFGMVDLSGDIVKKLSNKSVLIGRYGDVGECSAMLLLSIFTPLNNEYPNFEVSIENYFEDDPLIKQFNELAKKNEIKKIDEEGRTYYTYSDDYNPCNPEKPFSEIAKKIYDGTYSEDLNKKIEIAKLIADSLIIRK
jgi:hypothetical protein